MGEMDHVRLLFSFYLLTASGMFTLGSVNLTDDKPACNRLDDCSCQMADTGKIISLQDLDSSSGPAFPAVKDALSGSITTYAYNPCTPFSQGDIGSGSNCMDVLACGHNKDKVVAQPYFAIARPSDMKSFYDTSNNAYAFLYTSDSGSTITTEIILQCDVTVPGGVFQTGVIANENNYVAVLTSKCACPGLCSYTKRTSNPSKSGLTAGSILCIILLVVVLVYFIGGILINKYLIKREGKDVIPQVGFWTDLPFLVKDGFIFSYQTIRSKGHNQYEAIK